MSTRTESAYSYDGKTPSLADVIRAARRGTELDLRVVFPATVSAIQDGGAKVKVVPDIKDVLDTTGGEFILEPLEIPDIPVWTYGQGAVGGGYLQFPVRVGDKGWVHVADRSLDGWYQNGLPAPPAGYHTHNAIDGFFVNGARDMTRAQTPDPTGAAVFEDSAIKLGKAAFLEAARRTDATSADINMAIWITSVSTFINGLVAGTVVPPTDFGKISGGSSKVTIE